MDWNFRKKSLVLGMIYSVTITAHAFPKPTNFSYHGFYAGINGGYVNSESKTQTTTSFVPSSYFFNSDITQIDNVGKKNVKHE